LLFVAVLLMGCRGVRHREPTDVQRSPLASAAAGSAIVQARRADTDLMQASAQLPQPQPADGKAELPPAGASDAPLSVDQLVADVLARNPSIAQMAAAWQAASARYPQVISLDDPMFGATLAPGSIGSSNVSFGYRLEVSQKYPWPGKRGLKGVAATAEANAAANDYEDTRVQLIESARHAFAEYYLVDRALEVNAEDLRRLKEFRENAASLAKTGRAPEQDFLQADVEIGRSTQRQLTLERMRQVAVARINTLLNLPAGQPLPPAPKELPPPPPAPSVDVVQAAALANRPDLKALADKLVADQAALALAAKEYRPDFEVMAAYDAFWQSPQQALAPQVAVRMNVPVRRNRRRAAVAEAEARLAERNAELEKLKTQISFQVQEAYAQLSESERTVKLYTEKILPTAELNVKAVQAAFVTGKTPFVSLIEAQRSYVMLRDRYYEAVAELFRRRATLERVVGAPLPAER
jgi:outer membrane protein TolC